MDMPGVIFVLGRDPECWLVELNQPVQKLNFKLAFFAGSIPRSTNYPIMMQPELIDVEAVLN